MLQIFRLFCSILKYYVTIIISYNLFWIYVKFMWTNTKTNDSKSNIAELEKSACRVLDAVASYEVIERKPGTR